MDDIGPESPALPRWPSLVATPGVRAPHCGAPTIIAAALPLNPRRKLTAKPQWIRNFEAPPFKARGPLPSRLGGSTPGSPAGTWVPSRQARRLASRNCWFMGFSGIGPRWALAPQGTGPSPFRVRALPFGSKPMQRSPIRVQAPALQGTRPSAMRGSTYPYGRRPPPTSGPRGGGALASLQGRVPASRGRSFISSWARASSLG